MKYTNFLEERRKCIHGVILNDGTVLPTHTVIWAGGVKPGNLIKNIENCDHDMKSVRL